MKHGQLSAIFFVISALSTNAVAAKPDDTFITYKVINKSNGIIESYIPDMMQDGVKMPAEVRIQPKSSVTFNSTHNFKIPSMRNGESVSADNGLLFRDGEKSCYFTTSITATKSGNVINHGLSHQANSTGKQLTGCEFEVTEEQKKPPYSYTIELTMY
jgi:hypothetical protein